MQHQSHKVDDDVLVLVETKCCRPKVHDLQQSLGQVVKEGLEACRCEVGNFEAVTQNMVASKRNINGNGLLSLF